jgi:hypothetical protein
VEILEMIRPKTAFLIHFGFDGVNSLIHESALRDVLIKTGSLVQVHEDELDLIRSTAPSDLVFMDGKLCVKEVPEVVEPEPEVVVSVAPSFTFSVRDGIAFLLGVCLGGLLF